MSEFNVEVYRRKHESSTEWNLRREFLLAHHDKYSQNRLLCLANCFINVECYGCRYPDNVMIQLAELMRELGDVLDEYRNKSNKKYSERKFIKAKR